MDRSNWNNKIVKRIETTQSLLLAYIGIRGLKAIWYSGTGCKGVTAGVSSQIIVWALPRYPTTLHHVSKCWQESETALLLCVSGSWVASGVQNISTFLCVLSTVPEDSASHVVYRWSIVSSVWIYEFSNHTYVDAGKFICSLWGTIALCENWFMLFC